jgi:hypothetical protein
MANNGVGCGTMAAVGLLALLFASQCDPKDSASPKTVFDPQNSPSRMKRLVRARLKDPESAMFTIYADGCGLVNSRNSFGGMTGDQGFIVYPDDRVWLQEERRKGFRAEWKKRCALPRPTPASPR